MVAATATTARVLLMDGCSGSSFLLAMLGAFTQQAGYTPDSSLMRKKHSGEWFNRGHFQSRDFRQYIPGPGMPVEGWGAEPIIAAYTAASKVNETFIVKIKEADMLLLTSPQDRLEFQRAFDVMRPVVAGARSISAWKIARSRSRSTCCTRSLRR